MFSEAIVADGLMADVLYEEDQEPATEKALGSIRQKSPQKLIQALKLFFKRQANEVLKSVTIKAKALPDDWFPIDQWTREMFKELSPILHLYYDHSAKATMADLGVSNTFFNTVQPKLKEGVDKASMLFCQETNESTKLELTTAVDQLRQEVTEGLVEGDVKGAMMQRVQKVFDSASNDRAFRIGVTEASRGQHAAMEITARESGVVKGKTWLLSSDACPLCLPLSGKTVALGENFTTIGTGPYADIPYPPAHPSCRCTLQLQT